MEGFWSTDTAQGFVHLLVDSSQNAPQGGAIILDSLRKTLRLRRLDKSAKGDTAGEQGSWDSDLDGLGPNVQALYHGAILHRGLILMNRENWFCFSFVFLFTAIYSRPRLVARAQ